MAGDDVLVPRHCVALGVEVELGRVERLDLRLLGNQAQVDVVKPEQKIDDGYFVQYWYGCLSL